MDEDIMSTFSCTTPTKKHETASSKDKNTRAPPSEDDESDRLFI